MRKHILAFAAIALVTEAAAFERSAWQAPMIEEQAGAGTTIRIETPPAGLVLRKSLDPSKRYLLTVIGHGDPIVMRLQLGDRPHEYQPAPSPRADRVIDGADRIELLFYAEHAASYVLESAVIEECESCRTAADLKSRILREAPEIGASIGLEKALAVLHWAVNTADYSADPRYIPSDFESWPPEKAVFEFFDKDVGGVSCGGQSVFLSRVLHLLDIEAFTIGYGMPGTSLTHVTVVVPHEGKFYIVDPSFAATFRSRERYLDIDTALTVLGAGRELPVEIVELDSAQRDLHGVATHSEACDSVAKTPSGRTKCKLGPNSLLQSYITNERATWQRSGMELDNVALLRLMRSGFFSVGPSLDESVRERFIELIKSKGVQFHPS
jgi:hypothetical protein